MDTINIEFDGYGTESNMSIDMTSQDIIKWNQTWQTVFGCDILSMIRKMFLYTILFCKDVGHKFGYIDLSNAFPFECVYLHILNRRIINLLCYYFGLCDDNDIIHIKHHFDEIRLSLAINLYFITDYQNELKWQSIKTFGKIEPSLATTMSFGEAVNQASTTNDLLYWQTNDELISTQSKILQCFSPITVTNFNYSTNCSIYSNFDRSNNMKGIEQSYNCSVYANLTKKLKFFDFGQAFQHFDKIDIFQGYLGGEPDAITDWIKTTCSTTSNNNHNYNPNHDTRWIAIRKKRKNSHCKPSISSFSLLNDLFYDNFARSTATNIIISNRDTLLTIENKRTYVRIKSKLQQSFVYKINTHNYICFHNNTKRKRKLIKPYLTYLRNIDKDVKNASGNWIELQHFRNKDYDWICERRILRIATPNKNKVLNIAVLYKQKQIAKYQQIVLKLKQKKYGIYLTRHNGFDKLGKDVFLRSVCIDYLFPFEIFLLSRVNRGFYQLLHSDYTIIKKHLINREYKTKYYWKKIRSMIETLQSDSILSQYITDRFKNEFFVRDDALFTVCKGLLQFLEGFENINFCNHDTNINCCLPHYWQDEVSLLNEILKVISQRDHIKECMNDNCNCHELIAHPNSNILKIVGKMCLFWILTSQSKQYHMLNCDTRNFNFTIFSEMISVDKLISSLAMHYNCDDYNDESNKNNINLLFSHNIDTINFGNVKLILTQSQMYKMYSRNKKSFLIEYRVCDSQFIHHFNKFKYNAKRYD